MYYNPGRLSWPRTHRGGDTSSRLQLVTSGCQTGTQPPESRALELWDLWSTQQCSPKVGGSLKPVLLKVWSVHCTKTGSSLPPQIPVRNPLAGASAKRVFHSPKSETLLIKRKLSSSTLAKMEWQRLDLSSCLKQPKTNKTYETTAYKTVGIWEPKAVIHNV